MTLPSRFAGAAVAAALLIGAAAPAEARPRGWGGYGGGYGGYGSRGWHRRGGGTSFGDVVLGAAIIGGVAAVASSIANSSRDDGYAGRDDDGPRWRGDRYENGAPRADDGYRPSAEEDAAVERCARAAATQMGSNAHVETISHAGRDGAGWRVEGTVVEERGYGQSFVCGASADRVDFVQLRDQLTAR